MATNMKLSTAGEMAGYAYSPTSGRPSVLQAALAVINIPSLPEQGASTAWNILMARSVKPDYSAAPQWAIVP